MSCPPLLMDKGFVGLIANIRRNTCCFRATRSTRLLTTSRYFSSSPRSLIDATLTSQPSSSEIGAGIDISSASPVAVTDTWESHADKLHIKLRETLRSIFKFKHMSPVQQIIVRKMPFEHDLLVRSQTGTGKTLGFLIPAGQKLMDRDDVLSQTLSWKSLKSYGNKNASCLIISPTRELASQIATEARRLIAHKDSNQKARLLIGGDKLKDSIRLIARERNDFIVATPGRLLQMLEDIPELRDVISSIKTVIFDEADTLLDFGFKKDLKKIVSFLPKDRQTFLFSATLSPEVKIIAKEFMRKYEYIDTVPKDGGGALQNITQQYMIVPFAEQLRTTLDLINDTLKRKADAKIIVFLPTTTLTVLYRQAFSVLRQLYTAEHVQNFSIQSTLSQDVRSKTSVSFRAANSGAILFSTDVSARGVDYPGIDLVIQIGAARDADIYTHKVGRTGRAGKHGRSVLLLDPIERNFLKSLPSALEISEYRVGDLGLTRSSSVKASKIFEQAHKFISFGNVLENTFGPYYSSVSSRQREFGFDSRKLKVAMSAWFSSMSPLPVPPIPEKVTGGRRGTQRTYDHDGNANTFSSNSKGRYSASYRTSTHTFNSRGPPVYSASSYPKYRHEYVGRPVLRKYGRKGEIQRDMEKSLQDRRSLEPVEDAADDKTEEHTHSRWS